MILRFEDLGEEVEPLQFNREFGYDQRVPGKVTPKRAREFREHFFRLTSFTVGGHTSKRGIGSPLIVSNVADKRIDLRLPPVAIRQPSVDDHIRRERYPAPATGPPNHFSLCA
jgi:hypothetical protein